MHASTLSTERVLEATLGAHKLDEAIHIGWGPFELESNIVVSQVVLSWPVMACHGLSSTTQSLAGVTSGFLNNSRASAKGQSSGTV